MKHGGFSHQHQPFAACKRVDIDEKMNVTAVRNYTKVGSVLRSKYKLFIQVKIENIFKGKFC